MDSLEQRARELRAEIERLKGALLTSTDDVQRYELHARLNTCLRESIALIEQRLQTERTALEKQLRERHAGER